MPKIRMISLLLLTIPALAAQAGEVRKGTHKPGRLACKGKGTAFEADLLAGWGRVENIRGTEGKITTAPNRGGSLGNVFRIESTEETQCTVDLTFANPFEFKKFRGKFHIACYDETKCYLFGACLERTTATAHCTFEAAR